MDTGLPTRRHPDAGRPAGGPIRKAEIVARHRSPRGRHSLAACPQPVLRLALVGDGARHTGPAPLPVRKGIPAAAVAAGALTAAGASTPHLPTLPDLGANLAGVGLAAEGQQVAPSVAAAEPTAAIPAPTVLAPDLLDSRALATAVRQAGEEGERS